MTQNDNILITQDLRKSYGSGPSRVEVIRGLDLTVRRGEFLAIMGPSGCGKSTLLHMLGLLTNWDDGQILLDGQEITHSATQRNAYRRTHIGFVFQRLNLLGVLSAEDNVAISLRVRGLKDSQRTRELFDQLGISDVARRKPGQMSIGQQQRVAVARALAHRPAILLADEPTGSLDSQNGQALLDIFRQTNQRDGQTIIMITHSPQAAEAADRIIHMKDGILLEQHN